MAAGRLPLTAADPCHPGLLFGVGVGGGGVQTAEYTEGAQIPNPESFGGGSSLR